MLNILRALTMVLNHRRYDRKKSEVKSIFLPSRAEADTCNHMDVKSSELHERRNLELLEVGKTVSHMSLY